MDLIVLLFLIGFFGGILCFAAACGAYSAIRNKLDDIADKYRRDNLELTAELDRTRMRVRRYQNDFEELRKEYFKATAKDTLTELNKERKNADDIQVSAG